MSSVYLYTQLKCLNEEVCLKLAQTRKLSKTTASKRQNKISANFKSIMVNM